MAGGFDFDTREFMAAMRFYEQATLKDEAEIINRTAKNVILRAMSFVKKATAAQIRAELRALGTRLYALINARRKREGKKPIAGEKMAKAARAFVGKRARSAAYIRAGFIPAARKFGAGRGTVSAKGNAAQGYATRATTLRRVAEFVNTANESLRIGSEALERAVRFVTNDMTRYAERLMSRTADKFSVK